VGDESRLEKAPDPSREAVRFELTAGDRVVVKVGTASLVDAAGRPEESRFTDLCQGVAAVSAGGIRVVLVSSGAIAAGLQPLGLTSRPTDIPSLQAAAAVGQGLLLTRYAQRLADHGLTTAQVLLTRYDFMQRTHYLNARNTLERLLADRIVPVVNENDTVAVDEIRFGDNDLLAALVTSLIRARLLVLLTDASGVHEADPRRNPSAPLVEEIERVTPELRRAAGGRGSALASGGMTSKIEAAEVATFSGAGVVVGPGLEQSVLKRVVAGEKVGTYFHPRRKTASARRLWIAFGRTPRGTIVVDEGARQAIVNEKRSLLPVGVVSVEGEFSAGDAVDVAGIEGSAFARGLVSYGSDQLLSRLGRGARREVIHRDHLVVLSEEKS
jgi:glutamate 5-kinase